MFKNFKDKRWKLPKKWDWVNMKDIADITGGGTPKVMINILKPITEFHG